MILASASPRRRQIMEEIGLDFDVIPAVFDEAPLKASIHEPARLVEALALGKARAVAEQSPADEVVIGSDTVVVLEEEILGKPSSSQDAVRMLTQLSGKTHHVLTGVAIIKGAHQETFVDDSRVTFYDLTPEEIEAYVATSEPLDKAGAYGIQGRGRTLVKSIEGDFYAIIGLPIAQLVRRLRLLGVIGGQLTTEA